MRLVGEETARPYRLYLVGGARAFKAHRTNIN